jgi:hypothetical protein
VAAIHFLLFRKSAYLSSLLYPLHHRSLFFRPSSSLHSFLFPLRNFVVRHSFHHEVRVHCSIAGCHRTVSRCSFRSQHQIGCFHYDCHRDIIRDCDFYHHKCCRDYLGRYDLCCRKCGTITTAILCLYRKHLVFFGRLLAATLFRVARRRYHYPGLRFPLLRRTRASGEHLLYNEQSQRSCVIMYGYQCHVARGQCRVLSPERACHARFCKSLQRSNSIVHDQPLRDHCDSHHDRSFFHDRNFSCRLYFDVRG